MTAILMAPAPWTCAHNSGEVRDSNGQMVAYLPARFANQPDGDKVAAAICAHHNLVKVLIDLRDYFRDGFIPPKMREQLDAALAKAGHSQQRDIPHLSASSTVMR